MQIKLIRKAFTDQVDLLHLNAQATKMHTPYAAANHPTLNTATFTEPNRRQGTEDNTAPKREKREEECATMAALVFLKKTQLLKGERRQGQFCHF